jgi:hypothetical protein
LVSVHVLAADVVEQTATFGNHRDQSTPGVGILSMGTQVVGYLLDSLGKYRYLKFSGAGIVLVESVFPGNALPSFAI